MPRVHFRKENVTVQAPEGANLRELCLHYDIDPYPVLKGLVSCHGKGLCGTCAVSVDGEEGALSAPDKREARFLKRLPEPLRAHWRLSCRAEVRDDVSVETNPDRHESWKRHGYYAGRPTRSWERTS